MAAIIGKAWAGYKFLFEDLIDHRTESLFLAAKPYQGLFLLGIYLMFVLKWGPEWMKNRPAFNLKKIMIVYNTLQVLTCLYIFVSAVWYAWGWDYKWVCEPVDYSNSEKSLKIMKIVHYYFLTKVIDLLDTVFFVLRKKFNQVTFLHVYHHTGMVMLIWAALTYYPGGHGTLIGVINSFVHVVMYSYYLLTVISPQIKEVIWFKKTITQLQILQFLWCVIHMTFLVFKTDCEYPRWTAAVFLPQNLFMLILFIDFYIKAYIEKPKAKKITENGVNKDERSQSIGKENGYANGVAENHVNSHTNGKNKVH